MPNFFKEFWTEATEEHKGHKQTMPKLFKEFWTEPTEEHKGHKQTMPYHLSVVFSWQGRIDF